jgi:aspartate/methionine/tyrosine aminotransferase
VKQATRLDGITLSPIRRMNLGAPADAISLGLGEPTWPLPEAAIKALGKSRQGCSYGPNAGLPELRDELARFYSTTADQVMVAAGSQGALYALFQAWAGPGSQVLVPDPGFLAYPILARLSGAAAVPYALGPGGSLDADRFSAALDSTPAAAVAVINHPGNPCGGGADAEALGRVAEVCRERGILLIADEVYRELYLGQRPVGLRDVSDYGITLSSASKAWGAPGLRVGWAIGDPAVLEPARLIHNYMTTAAARPSQEAALALVAESATIIPAARQAVRERWEALKVALSIHMDHEALQPAGAFYYWLPLPSGAEADPMAFCLRVRDEGKVIIVPGLAFGEGGRAYARVSYAGSPAGITEGIQRLAPFWRKS